MRAHTAQCARRPVRVRRCRAFDTAAAADLDRPVNLEAASVARHHVDHVYIVGCWEDIIQRRERARERRFSALHILARSLHTIYRRPTPHRAIQDDTNQLVALTINAGGRGAACSDAASRRRHGEHALRSGVAQLLLVRRSQRVSQPPRPPRWHGAVAVVALIGIHASC